jgi:Protein of unknown function (DUF2924)
MASLSAEIDSLRTLTAKQLDECWRELFESQRPRRLYGGLLVGVLAYRLQEKALGGLKPATHRLLRQLATGSAQDRSRRKSVQPPLKTGSVLLREWHGKTHQVTVLEQGFQYGHERSRSLLEVARRITGTHRSAPCSLA